MKKLLVILFLSSSLAGDGWITKHEKGFDLLFTKIDETHITHYRELINTGLIQVETFFGSRPKLKFSVVIHPNRNSLDSTWRSDWRMPNFTSECWMVASGVATKLDLISPIRWSTEACEHTYTDTKKTQQLVTHELVHVFHAQQNKSPDFSEGEGIDWFVEGLATYASGQLDSDRVQEVKKLVTANFNTGLDKFWTGKNRYGLSGSMILYIDKHYGRATLLKLLSFSKKAEILSALKVDETTLLHDWKVFILASN